MLRRSRKTMEGDKTRIGRPELSWNCLWGNVVVSGCVPSPSTLFNELWDLWPEVSKYPRRCHLYFTKLTTLASAVFCNILKILAKNGWEWKLLPVNATLLLFFLFTRNLTVLPFNHFLAQRLTSISWWLPCWPILC